MAILKHYWWQIALTIIVFGTVFSVLGVYDTHALPFYMRFTFWTTTMCVGILTSILAFPYIVNKAFKDKHPFIHILIASVIASFPVTLVLTIFNPTFDLNSSMIIWGLQFCYVLLVSLVVGSIVYPLLRMIGALGPAENSDRDRAHTFMKRLPPKYHSAELYAISSEDHYLRVYTSLGEELILMRLGDALKELSDVNGLQVHRSWWVNRDSTLKAISEDGRKFLILKSAIKVPVSRTYRKHVKQELQL